MPNQAMQLHRANIYAILGRIDSTPSHYSWTFEGVGGLKVHDALKPEIHDGS